MSYDRYGKMRINGSVGIPPSVNIPEKSSDFFVTYNKDNTRLDLISYDYYGDPGYGWLILLANPLLSGLEYEIPDGTELRVPYPLDVTLEQYKSAIEKNKLLYGDK